MTTDYVNVSDDDLAAVFRQKLESDANWIRRALIVLLSEQTEDEQKNPGSVHQSNGRGFSPVDQDFLTSLANQVKREITLTERQMGWARKLLPKYAKQLVRILREKQKLEAYEEAHSGEFIPTFYFSNFSIENTMRSLVAVSGNLGIEEPGIPPVIVVTSPSASQVMQFVRTGEAYSSDDQRLEAVFYEEDVDGKIWKLTLLIGPPDEPIRTPSAYVIGPLGEEAFPEHLLAGNQKKMPLLNW